MTPALAMIASKGRPSAMSPSAQARTLSSEARSSWMSSNPPLCSQAATEVVRADHMGAVRRQGAGRLDAEAGGHAGDQDALASEVHALQHFVCC
jgi:hypothetical protein